MLSVSDFSATTPEFLSDGRGVETLLPQLNTAQQIVLVESIAGDSVVAHATAFCGGVESLAGATLSLRDHAVRSIAAELGRLNPMAGVALFVGVLVLLAACLAAIETLMARFTRLQSVELVLQALDILSRTASRYGPRGKKVFEVNQDTLVNVMRSLECLSFADPEEVLVERLKAWLKDPHKYDPEGWALALIGKS